MAPLWKIKKIVISRIHWKVCFVSFLLRFTGRSSGETMRRTAKSFRGARTCSRSSTTVPSLVGLGFHPPPGRPKTLSLFCPFVCLFVRHAFERQRLCARFREDSVGIQKRFWYHWIGECLQLCTRIQFPQTAAKWRHHYMQKSKKRQKLGFFAARRRQNKPIQTKFGT